MKNQVVEENAARKLIKGRGPKIGIVPIVWGQGKKCEGRDKEQ